MNDIKEHLEVFLRRVGLDRLIPRHRFLELSQFPLFAIGVMLLTLGGLIVRWQDGPSIFGALIPLSTLIIIFFVLLAYHLVQQLRSGKSLGARAAGTIGTIFLIGWPLLTAVVLGIWFWSLGVFLLYLLFSLAVLTLLFVLYMRPYPVLRLWRFIVSGVRLLPRSLTVFVRAFPLLIVLVLLSVFSEEYWRTVAQLPLPAMAGATLLVMLPAFILLLVSLTSEVRALLPDNMTWDAILETVERSVLSEELQKGFISAEGWRRLEKQAHWRHLERLRCEFDQSVFTHTALWLIVVLLLSSLTLWFVSTLYFFFFLRLLLPAGIIVHLLNDSSQFLILELPFLLSGSRLFVDTYNISLLKVSCFTATFTLMAFVVSVFTDEDYKRLLFGQLREEVSIWVSAALTYEVVKAPNYQIWDYVVRDKRKRLINVSIVVPKGLSDDQVKEACMDFARTLDAWQVIVITAYERSENTECYRRGVPARKWDLTWNKRKKPDTPSSFHPSHLEVDEPRDQDGLGFNDDGQKRGAEEIAPEWFGNTPEAVDIGVAIWEMDPTGEFIQHPYIHATDNSTTAEIHLSKRLVSTEAYRKWAKAILDILREQRQEEGIHLITIELTFRDTFDLLAQLDWHTEGSSVSYKDEHMGKTHFEPIRRWK